VANPEARQCVEFAHAADALLSEYMARMRSQLAEWIDRVNVLGADQVRHCIRGGVKSCVVALQTASFFFFFFWKMLREARVSHTLLLPLEKPFPLQTCFSNVFF
jgi:hypothetical protein